MTISIAGILFSIMVLIVLISGAGLKKIFLVIYSMCMIADFTINAGYFLSVGETIFKIPDFIQFVLFILSISIIFSKKDLLVNKNIFLIAMALSINLIALKMMPYSGLVRSFDSMDLMTGDGIYSVPTLNIQSYKSAIRIFIFIVNSLVFKSLITLEEWTLIKRRLILVGALMIAYCWFEFFVKNIFGLNTKLFLDIFFGLTIEDSMMIERNGLLTVHGFASEPSQLAMIIFYFMVFFILSDDYKISRVLSSLIWSAIPLLLLSGSFRAIGLIPLILCIYSLKRVRAFSMMPLILLLFGIFGVILNFDKFDFYLTRLSQLMDYVANPVSGEYTELARLTTVMEAFDIFVKNPLLGVGLGTTFAYGFLPSILASTGIIGTFTWYFIMTYAIGNIYKNKIMVQVIIVLSFAWLYTSAIDIAYSSVVLAIIMQMHYSIGHGRNLSKSP